jgi:hypothetical protein
MCNAVNETRRRLAVATVWRMDSRACWGIQPADVLAAPSPTGGRVTRPLVVTLTTAMLPER